MHSESAGRNRSSNLLAAGFAAVIAIVPFIVQAADPPAASSQAPRKPKPKPMSRDQLRTCMDLQDKVTSMRDSVLKEQAALDAQRKEVGRMDADLEKLRAALVPVDAADAKAVADGEARLSAVADAEARRNAASDAFNARLPAARDLNSNYNTERQRWVEQCANKDYDENDEAAIKRERQRAAKAASPAK